MPRDLLPAGAEAGRPALTLEPLTPEPLTSGAVTPEAVTPAAVTPEPAVAGAPPSRLIAGDGLVDNPPLAPWEPDEAERGRLLPLELLAWDATGHLVGVRCDAERVVLRNGRPPRRRTLTVQRLTNWARAGRLTLHGPDGDVELRLLAPGEYARVSLGDERVSRVAGPVRMARSGQLSGRRDEVARVLTGRVLRVVPDLQVGTG